MGRMAQRAGNLRRLAARHHTAIPYRLHTLTALAVWPKLYPALATGDRGLSHLETPMSTEPTPPPGYTPSLAPAPMALYMALVKRGVEMTKAHGYARAVGPHWSASPDAIEALADDYVAGGNPLADAIAVEMARRDAGEQVSQGAVYPAGHFPEGAITKPIGALQAAWATGKRAAGYTNSWGTPSPGPAQSPPRASSGTDGASTPEQPEMSNTGHPVAPEGHPSVSPTPTIGEWVPYRLPESPMLDTFGQRDANGKPAVLAGRVLTTGQGASNQHLATLAIWDGHTWGKAHDAMHDASGQTPHSWRYPYGATPSPHYPGALLGSSTHTVLYTGQDGEAETMRAAIVQQGGVLLLSPDGPSVHPEDRTRLYPARYSMDREPETWRFPTPHHTDVSWALAEPSLTPLPKASPMLAAIRADMAAALESADRAVEAVTQSLYLIRRIDGALNPAEGDVGKYKGAQATTDEARDARAIAWLQMQRGELQIGEDEPGLSPKAEYELMAETQLAGTMDAHKWAAEFTKRFGIDEGTMIGWFANAIMAGYDHGLRHDTGDSPAPELVDSDSPGTQDTELETMRALFVHATGQRDTYRMALTHLYRAANQYFAYQVSVRGEDTTEGEWAAQRQRSTLRLGSALGTAEKALQGDPTPTPEVTP